MNREMILRVADAIEEAAKPGANPAMGFNMNQVIHSSGLEDDLTGHSCGTVGCIAGWAIAVDKNFKKCRDIDPDSDLWKPRAGKLLGLNAKLADRLFMARAYRDLDLDLITPSQAVTVLRHLAETGKVDWSIASEASR